MTVTVKIQANSLEYVPITVTPPAGLNPTADPVRVAWIPPGSSAPVRDTNNAVWRTASWESALPGAKTFTARCLYGTEGTGALTPGAYTTFIWITDSPEAPVREAGILVVS